MSAVGLKVLCRPLCVSSAPPAGPFDLFYSHEISLTSSASDTRAPEIRSRHDSSQAGTRRRPGNRLVGLADKGRTRSRVRPVRLSPDVYIHRRGGGGNMLLDGITHCFITTIRLVFIEKALRMCNSSDEKMLVVDSSDPNEGVYDGEPSGPQSVLQTETSLFLCSCSSQRSDRLHFI